MIRNKDNVENMRELYHKRGWSIRQIADKYLCDRKTVRAALDEGAAPTAEARGKDAHTKAGD